MASETYVLDSVATTPGTGALTLTDPANGIDMLANPAPDFGSPDRDRLFAGSADTFGDPLVQSRYQNRTITLTVKCYGSESTMRARIRDLTKKVGAIATGGVGVLKRTLNDSTVIYFDLLDADIQVPSDWQFLQKQYAACTLTLLAAPAGRGNSSTYTTANETTNPELIYTFASPAGDLPALGQLTIDEVQGKDQWFVQWGIQCSNYSGSTTAQLAYAGTSRLAFNGAAGAAVSGALSGTALQQGSLLLDYTAMMGLASTGTAYCTHVGDFRVFARTYVPSTNTGQVTVALEWGQGDLRNITRNAEVALDTALEGSWQHVDLGQVHPTTALSGPQRWDGRIIAKSSVLGDKIAVDRVSIIPTTEGYGEVRGVLAAPTPTSFLTRDEFNQGSGNLNGVTAAVGGSWTTTNGTGSTVDFAVQSSDHTVVRTGTVDSGDPFRAGRYAVLGSSQTGIITSLDIKMPDAVTTIGLISRYTSASAFFGVYLYLGGTQALVSTTASDGTLNDTFSTGYTLQSGWLTLRYLVDTGGRTVVWLFPQNGVPTIVWTGSAPTLATGGVLASGKCGFIGHHTSGSTTQIDNHWSAAYTSDAAMYASQSLQIRHNAAIREDSTGTIWTPASSVRGDYLRVPAANVGGTCRMLVKASRSEPMVGPDSGIDDISATLTVTPLYLHVP